MKKALVARSVAAIFAITAFAFISCSNPTGSGTPEVFENITDVSALAGTWKGTYRNSGSLSEFAGDPADEDDKTFMEGVNVTLTVNFTMEIDGAEKRQKTATVSEMKFTNNGNQYFDIVWPFISQAIAADEPGATVNDETKTITIANPGLWEPIDETDLNEKGIKVNESKTSMIIPAGAFTEEVGQITLTKQ